MKATKQNYEHIINKIAQEYNLEVVSTTVGMNGYPSHVGIALEGFKSFDQYCEVRDKYNMQEYKLHRKDGWNLSERTSYSFFEPWNNSNNYNEDRERVWEKFEREEFLNFQYNDMYNCLDEYFRYDSDEYVDISMFIKKWEDIPAFLDYCEKNDIELYADIDNLRKNYNEKNEIYSKFETITDEQVIIEYYQYISGYEIADKYTCSYYEDTHHYSMGLGFEVEDLEEE